MRLDDLLEFYDYDLWASNRLLDAAAALEGAAARAFFETKGHGIGSARDLIVHVADAQLFWLGRIQGEPAAMPNRERFASIDEIRAHCAAANGAVQAWLRQQGEARLGEMWEYQFRPDGPVNRTRKDHLWQHVAIHGVGHRAEASELLTAAGSPPQSLDFMAYLRARQAP